MIRIAALNNPRLSQASGKPESSPAGQCGHQPPVVATASCLDWAEARRERTESEEDGGGVPLASNTILSPRGVGFDLKMPHLTDMGHADAAFVASYPARRICMVFL